jgi:hypothetical protein
MTTGIQRRQWLHLFLVLAVPMLLNGAAIGKDLGTNGILQILRGTYSAYPYQLLNIPHNPLPEILLNLLLITVPLGFLAWLMLVLSNQPFFQKQPLALRIIETLLAASLSAAVFAAVSDFLMPLAWLPKLHDTLLGLPLSPFMMKWSGWLVFPLTVMLLCSAVLFSGKYALHRMDTGIKRK